MTQASHSESTPPAGEGVSKTYANYVLAVLFLVTVSNFLDRQIIAILAEPVKRDLGLSDTQVGLMSGLSFALFYTLLSLPIAALSDRWNRGRIITISLATWSAMTVACGFATNFVLLFLARVGVGIGQAGSGPASQALIADLFPPERRAGALGLFGVAIPVGAFIAYAGGGWMVDNLGWRTAFIVAGAPGLALAVLVLLTVRDPRPAIPLMQAFKPDPSRISLKAALSELWAKRAYRHLIAAGVVFQFAGFGLGAFYGSFFVRIHGMSYAELGVKLGVMIFVVGGIGSWLGGVAGDRLGRKSLALPQTATALAMIIGVPITIWALYVDNGDVAILALGAMTFASTFLFGPTFSGVQLLARTETRAMAVAIYLFITSLIGQGLGPLFLGVVSDVLAGADPSPEEEGAALRLAMAGLCLFYIWSALHFWLAGRTIESEANEGKPAAASA